MEAGYPVAPLEPDALPNLTRDGQPPPRAFLLGAAPDPAVFRDEMGGHIILLSTFADGRPFGYFPLHLVSLCCHRGLFGAGAVFFLLGVPALITGRAEVNSLSYGHSAAWAWSTVPSPSPQVVPTGRPLRTIFRARVIVR